MFEQMCEKYINGCVPRFNAEDRTSDICYQIGTINSRSLEIDRERAFVLEQLLFSKFNVYDFILTKEEWSKIKVRINQVIIYIEEDAYDKMITLVKTNSAYYSEFEAMKDVSIAKHYKSEVLQFLKTFVRDVSNRMLKFYPLEIYGTLDIPFEKEFFSEYVFEIYDSRFKMLTNINNFSDDYKQKELIEKAHDRMFYIVKVAPDGNNKINLTPDEMKIMYISMYIEGEPDITYILNRSNWNTLKTTLFYVTEKYGDRFEDEFLFIMVR